MLLVLSCLLCNCCWLTVCIVVVVLCVLLSYVYLLYCVGIAFFTLDTGPLARSLYSEGLATGHFDKGFRVSTQLQLTYTSYHVIKLYYIYIYMYIFGHSPVTSCHVRYKRRQNVYLKVARTYGRIMYELRIININTVQVVGSNFEVLHSVHSHISNISLITLTKSSVSFIIHSIYIYTVLKLMHPFVLE